MSELKILVVENRPNWQEMLPKILGRIGGAPQVDLAVTYGDAVSQMRKDKYDAAVVDLALTDTPHDNAMRDEQGMTLLGELRTNSNNRNCGVVVLTGYPSSERTKRAIRNYGVHDFIEKDKFEATAFLDAVRGSILEARLKRAELRQNERYQLTILLGHEHLIGTKLSGPDRRETYQATEQQRLEVSDLSRRADNLNLLILKGGAEVWRPEARSVGKSLLDALARDHRIYGDLVAAKALVERFSDLAIEFCGPAVGLGVPFELMHENDDYLAIQHIVTRRIDSSVLPLVTRKPEPFTVFLQRLTKNREPLRILLIAANTDGTLKAVDEEVNAIKTTISGALDQIGMNHDFQVLTDSSANYHAVVGALRSGSYHIVHYAGHGRFADYMPEVSGLVLPDGNGVRTLTASDLYLLLRDSQTRLVYLSGCVGAQSGEQLGGGDFHGVIDALACADTPYAIGYRWTVNDGAAAALAKTFYGELLRSFSPGEALLEARKQATLGPNGRNEDSWASALLLAQNG